MVDYELLGVKAERAGSYDTARVHIRFKNVGTLEGSAWAQVFLYNADADLVGAASKLVSDEVGHGPGKDSLLTTYGPVGDYRVEFWLTSDTGTDIRTQWVKIRK